jgi:hypothetical protein
MVEKPEKAFTNIRRIKLAVAFLIAATVIVAGCDSDLSDDPIPYDPFSPLLIDLTLPSNNDLQTIGWKAYNDIGVRGVIVYKLNATTYLAYERNCSYQPNDACATVDVHSSNLYMIDACCGSTFNFSAGTPTSGPAWRNLRQYITTLNGSRLTVTDEFVE